jgi:hypothetical protein
MSLETLRKLRVEGGRPDVLLKVVAGRTPLVAANPDIIAVTDAPERMDWRPVVGLPVAFFVPDDALDLGERAFACACAAGCKPEGVVFSDGAHTLNEAAKPGLCRLWELLCQS